MDSGGPVSRGTVYYEGLSVPIRRAAVQLDRIVREEVPGVQVGIKWAVPFYFTDAGPLCYVSAAKRPATFGVARGTEIRDQTGLLSGTGRSPIRKATLRPDALFPEVAVREWLRQARMLPPEG